MSAFPVVHTYTLKYYLLNSSGAVVRSYTLENFQGNDGGIDFANIEGTDDRIYVVYKLWNSNQIKTRKSITAGQSWSNIADINISNNTCNHIDITFGKDDNGLHVVWATQDAGSDYKTYYKRLDPSNAWSGTEDVTDGSNVGGFPTISKSTNRVHVSYNTGQSWDPESNLGDANSRDKYVNTWQTPQNVQSVPQCYRERIHAGSSKLFDFNYQLKPGYYASDLYVKERSLNSSTWSSGQLLKSFAEVSEIVSAANSVDGKTHIVYEISGAVGYRSYTGSSWSTEENIGDGYNTPRIYSISNDLFTVWGKDWPNDRYIQYRQYDAVPLAPQNLTVSASANNHPLLSWTKNNEADIQNYKVYKYITSEFGWQYYGTVTTNSFEDLNESYPVKGGSGLTHPVQYKVTAVDFHPYESLPSNTVLTYVSGALLEKSNSGELKPSEFSLDQNYPNPFNPSTKISYSIKEEGLVTLNVYDILGKEIAILVNEIQPAGFYEVEFNASSLPSGMYIYKILSGQFSDVKKMLLTK
ncbi:MAG: T9SS type A sorting domain-containing protein [Ignavibacterium sp.]|nr:T9SS type A sorting domain-containing protein [Ignavibacterium sp.]